MDKLESQISRGIVTGLLICFLLWLVAKFLFPANNFTAKAKLIKTHTEARSMSVLLGEQADRIGGLTNLNRKFVFDSLFVSTTNYYPFTTNAGGEVIDIWQTPYQIELVGRTNFIVSSAGIDKIFSNADDIIFNSVSNDFMKP